MTYRNVLYLKSMRSSLWFFIDYFCNILNLSHIFRPHPGEIRQIYIEKSSEALGITIKENQNKKGVFVSSVSENSLANQVGLQVNYFTYSDVNL